jgi:mono/diheme cytochrome c family protein
MNMWMIGSVIALMTASISTTSAAEKSDFDVSALYRSNCASCHGFEGEGDGPVSQILVVQPQPLGTLAERHKGAFPYDYVYGVIDGRLAVRAHGTRDMPVWGKRFSRSHEGASPTAEETARSTELMIRALVDYIRDMQR